jgi:hemoglobin
LQKSELNKSYFDHWLLHYTSTVDELFVGEKAELTKQRANSIATVMQLKIVYK